MKWFPAFTSPRLKVTYDKGVESLSVNIGCVYTIEYMILSYRITHQFAWAPGE